MKKGSNSYLRGVNDRWKNFRTEQVDAKRSLFSRKTRLIRPGLTTEVWRSSIVFCEDYFLLLMFIPSRKLMHDQEGDGRYFPVSLLVGISWASAHRSQVKPGRITEQVGQSSDQFFRDIHTSVAKGTFERGAKPPLMSSAKPEAAYKKIWHYCSSINLEDVGLGWLINCATNALVDEHNEQGIFAFPGKAITLLWTTVVQQDSSRQEHADSPVSEYIVPEMTYQFKPPGVPPHCLLLKKGVPVMVIRNVRLSDSVKGKIFIVDGFTRKGVRLASHSSFEYHRTVLVLPRSDFVFSYNGDELIRRQLPLRVAFTVTVRKAQVQTLKKAIVDIRSPYFSPGQPNVALSRVRKSVDIIVLHKEFDIPREVRLIHPMPLAVSNPILKEALDLIESIR